MRIMQDDPFPAAERILTDIETVFKKDPDLREFDIIPVTLNQNKSPVHHIEHCLGLESWCVRHVYCYAYHRLLDTRQQRHRKTDPAAIPRLLLGAILLNPDVQTFWNMRRELVQSGRLDISSELHFTSVVLSKKPKSGEAFSHRKWLLGRLLKTNADVRAVIDEELKITQYAADRYANNYHAWLHRMWCLIHVAPAIPQLFDLYVDEWVVSEAWISMHVSDHSGLQYRQFLLNWLCEQIVATEKFSVVPVLDIARKSLHQYLYPVQSAYCEGNISDRQIHVDHCTNSPVVVLLGLIVSELLLSADLILSYAGHEALWCHRRFALSLLQFVFRGLGMKGWKRDGFKNEIDKSSCDETKNECIIVPKTNEIQQNKMRSSRFCTERASEVTNGKDCFIGNASSFVWKCDGQLANRAQKLVRDGLCEEDIEICCLISKSVPLHEEQLLFKYSVQDTVHDRYSSQHYQWLTNVLELHVSKP